MAVILAGNIVGLASGSGLFTREACSMFSGVTVTLARLKSKSLACWTNHAVHSQVDGIGCS